MNPYAAKGNRKTCARNEWRINVPTFDSNNARIERRRELYTSNGKENHFLFLKVKKIPVNTNINIIYHGRVLKTKIGRNL